MVLRNLWIAPLGSVISGLIAILSGYIIGVLKGHFPALLPYISDGGRLPPESCIFTQFLNLAAFLFALSCYMRHRMIVEYYAHRLNWSSTGNWRTVSQVLLGVAIASAVAVTILANFSVKEQLKIHQLSANAAFCTGLIYAWGQVLMGYFLKPHLCPMKVQHFRLIVIIAGTCAMILHLLCETGNIFVRNSSAISNNSNSMQMYNANWMNQMSNDSPKRLNHLISATAEWTMCLLFEVFVLSFVYEFRFAYMHAPRVIHHTHFDQQVTVIPDNDEHF